MSIARFSVCRPLDEIVRPARIGLPDGGKQITLGKGDMKAYWRSSLPRIRWSRFVVTSRLLVALSLIFLMRLSLCALVGQASVHSGSDGELNTGVVVETVDRESEGENATLHEGDVLLSWSRAGSESKIQSPFDVAEIEIEQGPRGAVTIQGLRNTEPQTWVLGPAAWGIRTRPNFSKSLLAVYLDGRKLGDTGHAVAAAEHWRAMAVEINGSQSSWLSSWLSFHGAEVLAAARQWKEADDVYHRAIEQAAGVAPIKAQLLRALAHTFYDQADWTNSSKYYQEALKESQRAGSENLAVALTFDMLGIAVENLRDLDGAERYHRQALAIGQRLAPEGLPVAFSLNGLGSVADDRGDLQEAEEQLHQALLIREKLAPNSLLLADSLSSLGSVAQSMGNPALSLDYQQKASTILSKLSPESVRAAGTLLNMGNANRQLGDLDAAEDCYRRAFTIFFKSSPTRRGVALSLNDLGMVAQLKGDLANAEDYFRRSLAIEKIPDDVAFTLENLGGVAKGRWDLERAEEYYQRALAIREKLLPDSVDHAGSLGDLGLLALNKGDVAKAEKYLRQSMAITEKAAPDSIAIAWLHTHIGDVAKVRGDLSDAEAEYRKAFEHAQRVAPASPVMVEIAGSLGDLFLEKDDLANAQEYYQQVLRILEKSAPGVGNASALAGLASIARRRNQMDKAAALFEQALKTLEGQTARLGGVDEDRAYFRAKYAGVYKEYIDFLVGQREPERAFEISERFHAKNLLEILSTARVDIRKGVDSSLVKRERTMQLSLSSKVNRRMQLLTAKHTDEQVAGIDKELSVLLTEYKELEQQIKESSPAYAGLTQPKSLNAKEVSNSLLDNNTLLLEYSLGDQHSYVFALTPDSLKVFPLPKRAEIEVQTRQMHGLLTARNQRIKNEGPHRREARVAKADAQYVTAASALSRILLDPVKAQLGHKRLLIIADGALLYVPFAGLPTVQSSDSASPVPLIVEHEIVSLPSASVLAILRRDRLTRKRTPKETVILADPVFDVGDERVRPARSQTIADRQGLEGRNDGTLVLQPELSDKATRSAVDVDLLEENQLHFPRLLFTRQEANAISAVAPPGTTWKALDFEASRVFAVSGRLSQYRVVHFATHALINDKHPGLSGLVLSLVDEQGKPQDGFLDLQDIYNLDLAADLVVLSSCETALGKQVDGEGMVGLTRGFMYAGASSVMGSLWKVSDFATAKLMETFYQSMEQERMAPSQALRHAQLALWKQKHWSAPYYWAGFTLQGDWK